jgi:hypothetical protein
MTRTTEEKDCQSALRQSCAADLENDMFRIPMGTNCAPLLADLFLYSYEADFMQGLHSQK